MAFVIEDGTGRENSTSYISSQEMKGVWDTWGYDYSALSESRIQVLLNIASRQIDVQYDRYFDGYTKNAYQALAWPRDNALYYDSTGVLPDYIPPEIKDATAIMAYVIETGVDMQPTTSGENLSHYRVKVDEIEEEKTFIGSSLSNPRPRVALVDDAMRKFTGGYSRRYDLKIQRVGG